MGIPEALILTLSARFTTLKEKEWLETCKTVKYVNYIEHAQNLSYCFVGSDPTGALRGGIL